MSAFTRLLTHFLGEPTAAAARKSPALNMDRLEAREVPASLVGRTLVIDGTDGDDFIRVVQRADRVTVYHDTPTATPTAATFRTSAFNSITISAGEGDDTISLLGVSVRSTVKAGAGNDHVEGGMRADDIYGGDGNDTVNANEGSDEVYGGTQNDTLDGGTGNDDLYGGDGKDFLTGGINDDRDEMWGNGGDDTIVGEAGWDRMIGGAGNDRLEVSLSIDDLIAREGAGIASVSDYAKGNGTDTLAVSMDLDSFDRKLVTPVLREVKQAVKVFDPLINALDRKVPVLSQFDGSLTFGSLLKEYSPAADKFLNAVKTVRDLSTQVSLSGTVKLGEFTLRSGSMNVDTEVGSKLAKVKDAAFAAARKAGLKFTLIDDPQSVVQLLLGKKVELVTLSLSMPTLSAGMSRQINVPTPIPGVSAMIEFGGKVTADARATFGLDTSGLADGRLMSGFFVRDVVASLGASAHVKGGVSLGVPNFISLGSIYGYGELSGTISFALNGGKKVYLDDLTSYSGGVKTSGQLSYDLGWGVDYHWYKGTDHKKRLGNKYTGYYEVVWTTYSWQHTSHRESLASGTFRL